MSSKSKISKYLLYEESVQSPDWQVDYLPQFHQWLCGKKPIEMREDFCGTGRIACEWVKRSPKNKAVGLDTDAEVLQYATKVNQAALSPTEQKRVQFIKQDVLKPTKQKFDLIGAYNFSFFIFHERKMLLKYLKAAHQSLKSKGTLFLEIAGGPEFVETTRETKDVLIPNYGRIEQVWEQHQYDPITQVCDYSIHFKLPNGDWLNDAFTYHWRIWTIRDLRELLAEAGFRKSVVLWDHEGDQEEFLPSENAEFRPDFLAYVVGVK